jgi:hypothetical protein
MMNTPFSLPALEMEMNSSTGRGPLQAANAERVSKFRPEKYVGECGLSLTGPDEGIVGEEGAVILPLRRVAVDRPALAELGNREPIEQLGGIAVVVRVALGVRIDRGSHG